LKILEARNITKTFPGVVALDRVDVSFELGKICCIVGENGAGKSTLIKILTGVYEPDEGSITIQGENALTSKKIFNKVAYVPQELDLFRNMTVAENLFIPFSQSGSGARFFNRKALYQKAVPYLKKFQIRSDPDELVRNISISEQQLLQIAHATVNQYADIIMLDEPTTSLTLKDTDRLFDILNQLKRENKALVFISHKLEEVFEIGDEITVIRNGVKVAHSQVSDVSIPWVVKQMTGREMDLNASFRPENISDDVLLEVEKLSGEQFADISFQLYKGEILGLSGLVGAGRSEIMQTVFGYLPAGGGTVKFDGKPLKLGDTHISVKNGIVYISEERKAHGIFPSLSVKKNISMPLLDQIKNLFAVSGAKESKLVEKVIDEYKIMAPSSETVVKFLSGGNQQKVIIGRSMFLKPKLLIFDEPTKGIDVGTKIEIYKLMKRLVDEEGVSIILISSELEEILKCSNRIITIYNGKKVDEFDTDGATKPDIVNSIIGIKN